ncbi:hypothetical protein HK097_004891 [Rhizophlyctis rosea]|uniref:Peptidase M48 domain-containing protein n=1 Tax=Rhizophlyctis rosea TaxID=64517 RepID=A0AAD5WZ84_9FUNG|nr:hypothetical protein HK097_004891 [Rhizophlyctis rosea]
MSQYGHSILPPHHPASHFVRKVAEKIVQVSGMGGLKWEVHVIDNPEKNAFVLPGGKIFVFTGILPIVQTEDGLAAVLGHEIAHQVARHSAEKLSTTQLVLLSQILLSFFIDPGFIFNRLLLQFGVLMPFSRRCEVEADYIGMKLMAQACYDPEAAVGVWKRMKEAERQAPPEYLSTHPSNGKPFV